ncbi:hypothetical protein ACK36Q_08795 [Aeromonas veronii]
MKRYDLELTATGPVMEERQEGAFVPFSEVSGLAEQLADATRQCGVMAGLLREVIVRDDFDRDDGESAGRLLYRIDSAIAGKMPDRHDTEWTDATTSPVAADYRELQEQYDQLQSKHKAALDLLRELREGAEIHLHNCKVCKNEEGVNNWTGKLARIDAALDGKFPLPAWYLDGAKDFKSMMLEATRAVFHPHIEGVFAVFERQLALDAPQGCESPQAVSPPLNLLIKMTDIMKMCRAVLITAHPEIKDETGKRVIQYRIKLATKAINMAEHAIDAAQANCGRFITEGQELELVTVLQSIVNGFSDDPAHDAAALLKRIAGEVPWTGDSFQLPPRQGG